MRGTKTIWVPFVLLTFWALGDMWGQGVCKDTLVVDEQEMFYGLLGDEGVTLQTRIDEVLEKADYYDPPVLFALAYRLFQEGEKEQAVFWFYLARVRSQFSVGLMNNPLRGFAEKKIGLYTEYFGFSIEKYALSHGAVLRPALKEVESYLENHPEHYNLLWPYTQRESLPSSGGIQIAPQEEWGKIREEALHRFKKDWQQLSKDQNF